MPLETQDNKLNHLENEIKLIQQQLQQQNDILIQLTNVNAHLMNHSIPTKKDVEQYQRQIKETQQQYIKQQQTIMNKLSECHRTLQNKIQNMTEQSIQNQLNNILENKKQIRIDNIIQTFNQALPGIIGVIGAITIIIFGLWWVMK